MKVIKRRRLHEDIVEQIRDLVRDGSLKHGDRLPPEREMSERLAGEPYLAAGGDAGAWNFKGWWRAGRARGPFINTGQFDAMASVIASCLVDSQQTVQDVFEMRRILEPGIAALAAERATEEDICQLESALGEQREQIERGESGVSGDSAFHFALAKATQNAALIKVVMAVADTLHQSRDRSLQTAGRAQRSLASHQDMLELVRSHDCEGAREAMEHHISVIETSHTEVESAV